MKIKNIEITLREFLVSIIILFLFSTVGIYINGKIYESYIENKSTYKLSTKIRDKETLDYSIKTKTGNSLIQGSFKSNGSVGFEELKGEYTYIRKVKEKYTPHIETVCSGSGKSRTCHTETYYTWDYYGDEEKYSKSIDFYGNKLKTKYVSNQVSKDRINLSKSFNGIKKYKLKGNYLYENGDTRYYYEYIPNEFNGAMFTNFQKDEKCFNEYKIFYNENIDDILKNEENSINVGGIVFTIFWFVLCGFSIYFFVSKENKWL